MKEFYHVTNKNLTAGTRLSTEASWATQERYKVFLAAMEDGDEQLASLLRAEWMGLMVASGGPEPRVRRMPIYAKEAIFEQVRLLEFASSPSRAGSAYLWRSYDDAGRFRHRERPDGRIVRCQSSDAGFRVDMAHFDAAVLTVMAPLRAQFQEARDLARCYWRGESSGNPMWEVLHQGVVTVVEPD